MNLKRTIFTSIQNLYELHPIKTDGDINYTIELPFCVEYLTDILNRTNFESSEFILYLFLAHIDLE